LIDPCSLLKLDRWIGNILAESLKEVLYQAEEEEKRRKEEEMKEFRKQEELLKKVKFCFQFYNLF